MSMWRVVSVSFASIASIWAARCLGPENLGISAMIVSTIGQVALLVNLNQTSGFVRYYSRQDTIEGKNSLLATVFTFRATCAITIMLIAIPVLLYVPLSERWYVGLIAAFPLFFFSVNQPDWALLAQGNLPDNYRAVTIQYTSLALIYIIFFRPGAKPGYDIIAQAFALFLYFAAGWRLATRGKSMRLWQWPLLPRIFPVLRENIWLALIGVVVYIYINLESPLIGYLYSIKEVGVYRASTTVLNGLQSFLVMIPGLLLPRLLEWSKQGPRYLWQRQRRIAVVLAALFLPLALIAWLVAPFFYVHAYGEKFARASFPFSMLFLSRLIAVLSGVFSYGLLAQRQDRTIFFNYFIVAVFSVTVNLLFIPRYGGYAASIVNCLSETLVLVLSAVGCYRLVLNAEAKSCAQGG